jgi:hypothetical protein
MLIRTQTPALGLMVYAEGVEFDGDLVQLDIKFQIIFMLYQTV